MSLFPAYADQTQIKEQDRDKNKSWLQNSSFKVDPSVFGNVLDSETAVNYKDNSAKSKVKSKTQRIKVKRKKSKKVERKNEQVPKNETNEYFTIETSGHKEYLGVRRIARPAAPIYCTKYNFCSMHTPKRRKFKRYFAKPIEISNDKSDTEDTITKKEMESLVVMKDNNFTGCKQEELLSKKTAYYNRYLAENSNNIQVWQDYIDFQNIVYQFEKTYRKGSIAKAQRVLAERKLCIVDKALLLNPRCEQLHRERLKILVAAYPSDELQTLLKSLVDKNKENVIMWQGYIEATQCSMSHCNTPEVIKLYTSCLSTLHQLRRTASVEKSTFEESILKMLYQCGLFLKQAGLFEQLWVLLCMYLDLNLSPNDNTKFNNLVQFREKQLFDLEEIIFTSQLPLHELWLRTEKLRESCHWLPHSGEEECDDPQRIVFADDVAELIHPITTPGNIFKLAATIIYLLKIPLLPCRHTTMQDLGLDYVPWSLDSIEPLLAALLPTYFMDGIDVNLFDVNRLAVGPQYLKFMPGNEEYLEFVLAVMQNCAYCMVGEDKVAIMVWLLRFQRLLFVLERLNRLKVPDQLKKKMRKNLKEFLRAPENRQNELYYLEYALIEFEQGNSESSYGILDSALTVNKTTDFVGTDWNQVQAAKCLIYKYLIFLHLSKGNQEKAMLFLCQLSLQERIQQTCPSKVKQAEEKFESITSELLSGDLSKIHLVHHFHPDFLTDWIICHAWLIVLSRNLEEAIQFMANAINNLENKNKEPHFQKEVLYEFYVSILFKHCVESPASGQFKVLDDVLHKAIGIYPNNILILSILAKEQTLVHSFGTRWWKIQNSLLATGRSLSTLFAIIILDQEIIHLQDSLTDTITGEHYNIDTNMRNRMLSLFKKITKSVAPTRRCGLIWRLYLQFVYTYCSLEMCRNVYYSAVEECPWLKALYIDAAIYIPAELSQIQDLIIEKQLRLHVTPEELEALRG